MYLSIENFISLIIVFTIIAGVIIEYFKVESEKYYKMYTKEVDKNKRLSEKCTKLKQELKNKTIKEIEKKYKGE